MRLIWYESCVSCFAYLKRLLMSFQLLLNSTTKISRYINLNVLLLLSLDGSPGLSINFVANLLSVVAIAHWIMCGYLDSSIFKRKAVYWFSVFNSFCTSRSIVHDVYSLSPAFLEGWEVKQYTILTVQAGAWRWEDCCWGVPGIQGSVMWH